MTREIRRIIVHCSATPPEWMADRGIFAQRAEIRRWHVDGNGWADIGYHMLIGRDGRTAAGRPLEQAGAHVSGHNEDSLGICLIGGAGSSPDDAPEWHFTLAQIEALRENLRRWVGMFPRATVHGHNEFSSKACPGFRVGPWWESVR